MINLFIQQRANTCLLLFSDLVLHAEHAITGKTDSVPT